MITAQKSTFFLPKNPFSKTVLMLISHYYLILQVVKSQTSKLMFSLSTCVFSSLLGIFTALGLHEDQEGEHFGILSSRFEALE